MSSRRRSLNQKKYVSQRRSSSSTQQDASMDVIDGDGAYQYGLEDSSLSLVSFTDDGIMFSSGLEGSSVVVDSVAGAIDDDIHSTNGLEGSYTHDDVVADATDGDANSSHGLQGSSVAMNVGADLNHKEGPSVLIVSSVHGTVSDGDHPSNAKGPSTQLVHGHSSIPSSEGVSFNLGSCDSVVGLDIVTTNIYKGDGVNNSSVVDGVNNSSIIQCSNKVVGSNKDKINNNDLSKSFGFNSKPLALFSTFNFQNNIPLQNIQNNNSNNNIDIDIDNRYSQINNNNSILNNGSNLFNQMNPVNQSINNISIVQSQINNNNQSIPISTTIIQPTEKNTSVSNNNNDSINTSSHSLPVVTTIPTDVNISNNNNSTIINDNTNNSRNNTNTNNNETIIHRNNRSINSIMNSYLTIPDLSPILPPLSILTNIPHINLNNDNESEIITTIPNSSSSSSSSDSSSSSSSSFSDNDSDSDYIDPFPNINSNTQNNDEIPVVRTIRRPITDNIEEDIIIHPIINRGRRRALDIYNQQRLLYPGLHNCIASIQRNSHGDFVLNEALNTYKANYLGDFNVHCEYCHAKHFELEKGMNDKFYTCCGSGKVVLPELPDLPNTIRSLLQRDNPDSREFINNIIRYNNSVALASLAGNNTSDDDLRNSSGPLLFKCGGNIYHTFKSALDFDVNDPTRHPVFNQYYMIDGDEATHMRSMNRYFCDLKPNILEILDSTIREYHPLAQIYNSLRERVDEVLEENSQMNRNNINLLIEFKKQRREVPDIRRYNTPQVDEVAVIYQYREGGVMPERSYCCFPRSGMEIVATNSNNEQNRYTSGQYIVMKNTNSYIDCMVYPVMFPTGRQGWYPDLLSLNRSNQITITMLEYYNYMLQMKDPPYDNYLLKYKKLTLQYITDNYIRVEQNRINYIRNNQNKLRASTYQNINNMLEERGDQINENDRNIDRIGKAIILPSSFVGSPRNLQQKYMDAMSVVREYGKPDLFITFTCNPDWLEIKNNIPEGYTVNEFPDLVSRVFHLKLKQLLSDIKDKNIFGTVEALLYSVEFQKRGLPHSHILIILDTNSKYRTEDEVDSIISAEIPDKESTPLLYELVKKHMIHGPCGPDYDTNCVCIDRSTGKCSKRFPKEYIEQTNCHLNSYPLYQRRNIPDRTITLIRSHNTYTIDNRWVVPYNPYLLLKYQAHINVEVCCNIQSTKYIYKYALKGNDSVIAQLRRVNDNGIVDETQAYLDCRYVSPPEASYRLNCFEITYNSVSINRLPIHLPDDPYILFREGHEVEALRNSLEKGTKLTKYFDLEKEVQNQRKIYTYYYIEKKHGIRNMNNVEEERELIQVRLEEINRINSYEVDDDNISEELLKILDEKYPIYAYHEIPKYYVWKSNTNTWNRRQRDIKALGRMYYVNPKDKERYALRLLLLNTKGADSFDSLKIVKGLNSNEPYRTFSEAAIARGLLNNEREVFDSFSEAIVFATPCQLRQLFITYISESLLTNVKEFWIRFKSFLSEDYKHSMHNNEIDYINTPLAQDLDSSSVIEDDTNSVLQDYEIRTLQDIKEMMISIGVNYNDLGLPQVEEQHHYNDYNYNPTLELQEANRVIELLNEEQRNAFDRVIHSIESSRIEDKLCFFIDGPGGSGKTFLYNSLLSYLRGHNKNVLPVASTGIASTLLPGGRTAHKQFGIPLNVDPDSTSNIDLARDRRKVEEIRIADLIIWDEAPMMKGDCFMVVHRLLCDIMNTELDIPFGGKTVVLGGDFRQCLPVIRKGTQAQIVSSSIKFCSLWNSIKNNVIHLSRNMRALEGADDFRQWLLQVGDGVLSNNYTISHHLDIDYIPIPPQCIVNDDLCVTVFGHRINTSLDSDIKRLASSVILASTNDCVGTLNDFIVDNLLSGTTTPYISSDSILDSETDDPESNYPIEFINSQTPSGMPPHILNLKIGCIIMLLRNLNPSKGLCNGTRLIVTRLGSNNITATILNPPPSLTIDEQTVIIPRIICNSNPEDLPIIISRRQFPIRLAFAMTINKSQGQTFERVGVYLDRPVFSHGQLYVAFSRARSFNALFIKVVDSVSQGKMISSSNEIFTKNVVFRSTLNN
ncbi:hypothetical protein WA158_002607 [Blastocystis sp. Blastoise]